MSANSKIEWTEKTWNPIAAFLKCDLWISSTQVSTAPFLTAPGVTAPFFPKGTRGWFCVKVSPGCANCYAEGINFRLGNGLTYTVRNFEFIELRLVNLEDPLKWRKPCMVFVNSMTDLFLEHIPQEMIDRVLAVIQVAQRHTFQILTKRADRMRDYFIARHDRWIEYENELAYGEDRFECDECGGEGVLSYMDAGPSYWGEDCPSEEDHLVECRSCRQAEREARRFELRNRWPLPNVWLAVSAENQEWWNKRVAALVEIPARIRFVSAEPLLGPIKTSFLESVSEVCGIQWVIVGGESGLKARPCAIEWIRDIVNQCKAAGVPVFVKQLGAQPTRDNMYLPPNMIRDRKGGDPEEWPEDLRIREFPTGHRSLVTGHSSS